MAIAAYCVRLAMRLLNEQALAEAENFRDTVLIATESAALSRRSCALDHISLECFSAICMRVPSRAQIGGIPATFGAR
ncbi:MULTISPECIES: hypothetical protein [unclassified Nocardia]|uniref:hypothetical protein n=1 Tax=unclassified Nocardia TaxID=2637762 RepID=UPI0033AC7CD8